MSWRTETMIKDFNEKNRLFTNNWTILCFNYSYHMNTC